MGKYSEALKKIEEERKKESGAIGSGNSNPNLKRYVIAAILLLIFVLAIAYGYGLRHGVRSVKAQPSYEAIPSSGENTNESEALLQDVEKMVQLSYGEEEASEKSTSAANQLQGDYYTIQLAAFQEEIRARQEVQKLTHEGLDVFVLDSGQFYVVSLGRFLDRNQATERLSELKKSNGFQDAFIRLVKIKK